MSSDLKKYFLGDVLDLKSGKSRPKEYGVYPVYGGNGILDYTNQFNTTDETIIIGRVGAYCGAVYFENKKIWISDNALYAKAKDGFISKYLFYYLKNRNLNTMAGGSSHPLLTQGQLNQIEVTLPNKEAQNRIASILSSIDEAIELNQQTNKTLEEIAQTLFADMCLPKNGAKRNKIGDFVETISSTHKMKQEKIIFLNTSDILEGKFLHNNYSVVATLPGQAKKSIKRNDILYSEIRPANKRFAFVNFDAVDYVVSTKLMVLRSKGILNPYFIYCFLTNKEVLNQLQHLAESRSGTFPQITFTQLKEMEFVLPDKNTLDNLTKAIQSLYETIFSNSEETKTLNALRNLLLPKLMKGEIEIK